jgi:hypothetical protein
MDNNKPQPHPEEVPILEDDFTELIEWTEEEEEAFLAVMEKSILPE